jgi:tetratricopeptide (TPR) repeat protein
LSDESVVRLIARRFIPYHFDLADGGAAEDAAAKRAILAAKPELAGADVHNPPLLVLSPAGELIGEIESATSEEALFSFLRGVLAGHSDFDAPSEEEREWERRAREGDLAAERALAENARVLGDVEGAARRLALLADRLEPGPERDRVAFELGQLHRSRGDFAGMERAFARIAAPAPLEVELGLERARQLLAERRYEDLRARLGAYDLVEAAETAAPRANSPRVAEAIYLLGIAHFHLGDSERAEALWRALVKRRSPDAWVLRADWAVFELTAARGAQDPRSQLGRKYAGRAHPDLAR